MSDEVDQSVESNDTPVVEESAPQAEPVGAEAQASAPERQEEKQAPFHEHPRFKELIEQNRYFKEQDARRAEALEKLQGELQYVRNQVPKKEVPKNQFIVDLEKVNPEYAKYMESVQLQAAKSEELERRIASYEQQQFQEKAINHFNSLLEGGKITDPMDRKIYERAIRAEVYERESRGEKLGLKELDKIFNEFHGEYKTAMDTRERNITSKYVTAKKSDTTPKGATGGAASAPVSKKFKSIDSPDTIAWLAKGIRDLKKE